MVAQARRRRRFAVARVALGLVALLVQGILLPLAHAVHAAAPSEAELTTDADPVGGARAAAGIHRASSVGHDAATCLLCATLAHGRTATASVTANAPAPHAAPGVPHIAAPTDYAAATCIASGARAPPTLSA